MPVGKPGCGQRWQAGQEGCTARDEWLLPARGPGCQGKAGRAAGMKASVGHSVRGGLRGPRRRDELPGETERGVLLAFLCIWSFPEQVELEWVLRSAGSPLRAALLPAARRAWPKSATSLPELRLRPAAGPDLPCTQKRSFSRPDLLAEWKRHLSLMISVEMGVAEGLLPKNCGFCMWGVEKCPGLGASLVPGASPSRISVPHRATHPCSRGDDTSITSPFPLSPP